MTPAELIKYYADLLILQYKGKPRAYATVQALVDGAVMDNIPLDVQGGFEIETAVGAQLDVLAKYVGVYRSYLTTFGLITLVDADFRVLIKFAAIKNSAGSSLSEIQDLLFLFFPGQVFVFDHKNMRMSYIIDSDVGSVDLTKSIIAQDLLPVPMAVGVAPPILVPQTTGFFGFRTYVAPAYNASPFNDYDNYLPERPWMIYPYAVSPEIVFMDLAVPLILEDGSGNLVQENDDILYT